MSFLLEAIRRRALDRPYESALEDADGRALTWIDLRDAMYRELRGLRETAGAGTARPLALLADHGIGHCVADLALMESGIPVLSLPQFFTPAQREHALCESGAQGVVREFTGGLAWRMPHVSGSDPGLPTGTARISYTSGSTGTPKGICLSGEHLLRVAHAVVDAAGRRNVGRHLAILPPGLLLETVAGCYATLQAGGTYIAASQSAVGLTEPFRPNFRAMAAAIERLRANSIILVPEYLAGLVAWLEHSGQRLKGLTLVAVGGARISARLLSRALAAGLPVRQGYGLTECGSVVSLHDGDSASLGSVGRSLGAHRLHLAPDGEIMIDGPLFLGTVGAPRAPGPLHTGDIGRFDERGRLWIEGRKSNLIVTSFGRNVSPEWIESLLLEQPAVAQALVHGDGAAQLSALLVARGDPAGLAVAVAAVNAQLPDYAHIGAWRQTQPFTVANGQLTGNGRLRRAHIYRRIEESADVVL
jgi:long-subunit acyl-CoA synthetase (AMP-forming)